MKKTKEVLAKYEIIRQKIASNKKEMRNYNCSYQEEQFKKGKFDHPDCIGEAIINNKDGTNFEGLMKECELCCYCSERVKFILHNRELKRKLGTVKTQISYLGKKAIEELCAKDFLK